MVCSLEVEALLIRNKLISEVLQGLLRPGECCRRGWEGGRWERKGMDSPWTRADWRTGAWGEHYNIYFLPPQFEKDRVNQVQNVKIKVQELIIAPWKIHLILSKSECITRILMEV